MDAAGVPLETLLAHRAWVRAVARAVVRDPNAADDLEQETWVAALATPPREATSLRGWLGTVVRSRARRAGRTDTRRVARETVAARGESVASAAELAEIADTHRRVVEAVVALDEPFRETILLRYFEGLAVEEVARRTACPLETTRSRLKRGVTKLRERLSRDLGTDERPWHLALAPLLAMPKTSGVAGGAASVATGGAIVATKTTWAVIGVIVAAGAAGALALKAGDDPKATPAPEMASAPAPQEKKPAKPPVAVPRQRAAEADEKPAPAAPAPAVPKEPQETAAERLARVKVTIAWERTSVYEALVDLRERSGVEMTVSAEAVERFAKFPENAQIEKLQLNAVPAKSVLDLLTMLKGLAWTIEEPRVVIVPKGVTRDPSKPLVTPASVVMPPKLTVVGRVVDANGVAVPGAKIIRDPGSDEPVATADIAGRFELKLAKPYGSLAASAPGQVPSLAVSVTGEPGAQVTIDLATRGAGGAVTVRVVADADGKPIKAALVHVGTTQDVRTKAPDGSELVDSARLGWTDEQGALSLDGLVPGRTAVKAHLAGFADAQGEADIVAGKSADITLRLVAKAPLTERLKSLRISFKLDAVSLNDTVHFISTVHQLNIVIEPSLAIRTEGNNSVTLAVNDVTVKDALDALCRAIGGAEWVIDDKSDVILLRATKK